MDWDLTPGSLCTAVNRHPSMDQIVQALGLINSFRLDGLTGSANPTSGARLNLAGALESLSLTAKDGEDAGIDIHSKGFGINHLSLPTPQDPSIALDPFLSHIQVDLRPELYQRLAEFAKEPLLAGFHEVINRIVLSELDTVVRLTPQKVVHLDIRLDHVHIQHDDEPLIRVKDVYISLLDYNTKLPPKEAQKACKVILRSLRVEVEEELFAKVLTASKSKIPPFVRNLNIGLVDPNVVVKLQVKKVIAIPIQVAVELETENDLFGFQIDVKKVPNWALNLGMSKAQGIVEKKLKGLVEISNESIRVNPWSKVPVDLVTSVSKFAVEDGKIVIVFGEPKDREVPPGAEQYNLEAEREPQPGDVQKVLAPGPAL